MRNELVPILIIAVVIVGFMVGQWWSERSRGLYEMRQAWKRRKHYRNPPRGRTDDSHH